MSSFAGSSTDPSLFERQGERSPTGPRGVDSEPTIPAWNLPFCHTHVMKPRRLCPSNAAVSFVLTITAAMLVIGLLGGAIYLRNHRAPGDGFPVSLTYNDRHYDRSGSVVSAIPLAISTRSYEQVGRIDRIGLSIYAIPGVEYPAVIFAAADENRFLSYVLQGG